MACEPCSLAATDCPLLCSELKGTNIGAITARGVRDRSIVHLARKTALICAQCTGEADTRAFINGGTARHQSYGLSRSAIIAQSFETQHWVQWRHNRALLVGSRSETGAPVLLPDEIKAG